MTALEHDAIGGRAVEPLAEDGYYDRSDWTIAYEIAPQALVQLGGVDEALLGR
jgi:hypothetical protein